MAEPKKWIIGNVVDRTDLVSRCVLTSLCKTACRFVGCLVHCIVLPVVRVYLFGKGLGLDRRLIVTDASPFPEGVERAPYTSMYMAWLDLPTPYSIPLFSRSVVYFSHQVGRYVIF